MKHQIVVTDQARAIEELARILHVKRQKIAELVARKRHPLPLPPTHHHSNHFVINHRYLRQLRRWVVEEKSTHEQPRTRLDLTRIEQELLTTSCPDHLQEKWSVEDTIHHFPPGDFLG